MTSQDSVSATVEDPFVIALQVARALAPNLASVADHIVSLMDGNIVLQQRLEQHIKVSAQLRLLAKVEEKDGVQVAGHDKGEDAPAAAEEVTKAAAAADK